MNFKQRWQDLSVIVLERKRLNHCPIVVRDKIIDYELKPFRVYDFWFEDEEVVKRGWEKPVRSVRLDCRYRDTIKKCKNRVERVE